MTVRLSPEYLTRAPFALAWGPSPASITPALSSSSLNWPISASASLLGSTPASDSSLALTSIMNRIVVSPRGVGDFGPSGASETTLYLDVDREALRSTSRVNFFSTAPRPSVGLEGLADVATDEPEEDGDPHDQQGPETRHDDGGQPTPPAAAAKAVKGRRVQAHGDKGDTDQGGAVDQEEHRLAVATHALARQLRGQLQAA